MRVAEGLQEEEEEVVEVVVVVVEEKEEERVYRRAEEVWCRRCKGVCSLVCNVVW